MKDTHVIFDGKQNSQMTMRILWFSLLAFLGASLGHEIQAQSDKIILDKYSGQYEGSGDYISYDEIKFLLAQETESKLYLDRHKSGRTGSQVLGFIGGALIGWPLGGLIAGNDMNWPLFGAGAGIAGISFAIEAGSKKNLQRAVDAYNAGNGFSLEESPKLVPIVAAHDGGLGIILKF